MSMSLELSNFDEMSKQIAKDFLRSVVIVDDHPVFEEEEIVGKLEPPDLVVEAIPDDIATIEGAVRPAKAAIPLAEATVPSGEAPVPPTEETDPHTLPFNRF